MDPQPSIVAPGAAARCRDGSVAFHDRPPLVILGSSCRAAAASATAAGWAVHAADLFDDVDLAAAAVSTRRIHGYPDALVDAAASFPAAPWCYTGAVENHRRVIERVAATRPLAGNGPAAVRRVRDPAALAAVVGAAGLRYPDTHGSAADLPTDGSFLRKPLASAGGHGIAPRVAATDLDPDGFVWQRRIAGEPLSAVFSLFKDAGHMLGLSRQLVGAPWCRAAPFAYSGSIRIPPASVAVAVRDRFNSLATVLATRCGLAGVVGVDAVLEPDGSLTVIEVNPRPTASAELVERATGASIMATHLAAFGYRSPTPTQCGIDTIWSKAILFAAASLAVDAALLERLAALADPWTRADGRPALADIPRAGQVLTARAPVVTIFAQGGTEHESAAELRRRVEAVIDVTG